MFARKITHDIIEALSDTPAVFLRGARQTGKSTLVQAISKDLHPARYLTLDNAGVLAAASADPVGFIAGLEKPVVLDEVQRLESLFLAIKEDVDRHRTPGRYLLTGSADVLALPLAADALVGRMEVLTLWPLCISEITGQGDNIIDTLFGQTLALSTKSSSGPSLADAIITGGFPEPLQRVQAKRRQAWFESYMTTLIDRDIRSLAQIQEWIAIPRLLKLLAARTATLNNQSEISRSSGIANSTLSRYMALLKTLFLIRELPAWSINLGKRLVKAPKFYLVDTGLACHLLDADEKQFLRQDELSGRLFENFIVIELFKHAAWSMKRVKLYHFRAQTGQEVDVVLESGGQVIGMEIKLSATPSPQDFAGLRMLKQHLGEKFVRGVLVYTGRDIIPFGENLHAVPVSALIEGLQ
jgi:hypothetical protein